MSACSHSAVCRLFLLPNHAAANFDYHKIVPQYEAIYERVLEAP